MQRFGHMDHEAGEYVITTPETPKSQENFLFNERYFACVNQCGNGYSKYGDAEGHYTAVISGQNEPYYEPGFQANTRLLYVQDRDTGEFWNVGFYPACREPQQYECRHGIGYTVVRNVTDKVEVTWRLFVPLGEDPVEIWTVAVKNRGRKTRRLALFAAAELSLRCDVSLYGHESYLHSLRLERTNGVAARKVAMNLPNPYFAAVFLSSRRPASFDANWNTFVGQFRTLANPVSLERGRCSGGIASRDRIAGVLHFRHKLEPGRSVRTDFAAGAADAFRVEAEGARYGRKYLASGKGADGAFEEMRRETEARLARVAVTTPERKLDALASRWIPQLIQYGATHCRWGIMGYRDIVQQTQGAAMFNPQEKTRGRFEQVLRYQFRSGNAPRGIPAIHEDSGMKYADSAMWLIVAVTEYLKETGDLGFLRQRVPYLSGSPATVWDHLERAARALGSQRGAHGLSLIREGDWNDSLTHVGRAGRGESVWLSQAFCFTCLLMEELALKLGRRGAARRYRHWYEQMRESLNRDCWDGAWYVRAFDDEAQVIGSRTNKQGRIFLNTQSWALLSRTVPEDRLEVMLRSVKQHLETPWGHQLLHPMYTRKQDNVGRLSLLEPGCSENGSVYTHGESFLVMGLLQAGRADEAYDALRRIMPYNPDNPSDAVLPYQLSNGYGGRGHRYEPGRAQYGWVTGSGTWMHMAIVEFMLGARRTYEGLVLRPCLPSHWDEASLHREYRGCVYDIGYRREGGGGNGIASLQVEGSEHAPGTPLPVVPGEKVVVEVALE